MILTCVLALNQILITIYQVMVVIVVIMLLKFANLVDCCPINLHGNDGFHSICPLSQNLFSLFVQTWTPISAHVSVGELSQLQIRNIHL